MYAIGLLLDMTIDASSKLFFISSPPVVKNNYRTKHVIFETSTMPHYFKDNTDSRSFKSVFFGTSYPITDSSHQGTVLHLTSVCIQRTHTHENRQKQTENADILASARRCSLELPSYVDFALQLFPFFHDPRHCRQLRCVNSQLSMLNTRCW